MQIQPTCRRGEINRRVTPGIIALFGLLLSWCPSGAWAAEERIPRPGQYSGYSEAAFDDRQRASRYVTVRDGTKIALDILRPTKNGVLHVEPLPVVWKPR